MKVILKGSTRYSVLISTLIALLALLAAPASAATPVPSSSGAQKHCVVRAEAPGDTTPIKATCYTTFGEAISAATSGRVHLANGAKSRLVSKSEMSAGLSGPLRPNTTYVIGIDYSDANFGGNTLTLTESSTCGSWQLQNFPGGWNDVISSFAAYSGCASTLFWNTSFGSPTYPIGVDGSASSLGVFNDNASSQKWCPAYAC